jgi:hypothetical protein
MFYAPSPSSQILPEGLLIPEYLLLQSGYIKYYSSLTPC